MGRKPVDKPKSIQLAFRTFPEIEQALSVIADDRRWSVSQTIDILIREKLIEELKRLKKPTKSLEDLP